MLKIEDSIVDEIVSAKEIPRGNQHGISKDCRIKYRLNSRGYRCDEFDKPHDISVVTLGCSFSFGWGIEKEETFAHLFSKRLEEHTGLRVANWNLSLPGRSNDYISRMTLIAQRILKPDFLLASFSFMDRREYFHKELGNFNYVPHLMQRIEQYHPEFAKIGKDIYNVQHYKEDHLNFYKNYKLTEMTCKLNDIKFFYTKTSENWHSVASIENNNTTLDVGRKPLIGTDPLTFIGYWPALDATTDQHPGPKSNQMIADLFWKKYLELCEVRHNWSKPSP